MIVTNEEYNLKVYWDIFRHTYGLDKLSTYQEELFWDEARKQREWCWYSDSPEYAIMEAFPYDKPAMLEKWWEYLSFDDKQKYLISAWLGKGSAILVGYNWWVDKFKQVGYLTNTEIKYEEIGPITLYRGSLPNLKVGMSWTPKVEFANLFKDQYRESKIYTIQAESSDILGIMEGIVRESDGKNHKIIEYILDTHKLDDRIEELVNPL